MSDDRTDSPKAAERSRYTDPDLAVDHVRRVARETAEKSGYRAAAFAVMEMRQEYRIMPLKQKEVPPERLATWQAVRMETRSLVPMAMGAHGGVKADAALFDERVATPADQPLPPAAGSGTGSVGGPPGGRAPHARHQCHRPARLPRRRVPASTAARHADPI